MGINNSREDNIRMLENLARKVLELKNEHRQRRPIVIEFCGSPKAGKTSSINSLNIFLKRNGFRTAVLTERASVCPIADKQSPVFNVWTCTSTINEMNAKLDQANNASSPENNLDVIICDRGIFDALCWFRWLRNKKKMSDEEYDVITKFALLNRWRKNIDLVYAFVATPEESIKREYANLLTDKRGSIMKEDILTQYKDAIKQAVKEHSKAFRAIEVIDTTKMGQNDVGYIVTTKTLNTLKDMLMERIGYVERENLRIHNGINDYSLIRNELEYIKYGLRDEIEQDNQMVQPIAIALITSLDGKKVFCVKKAPSGASKGSPEKGHTLLYVGGHMRKEDCPDDHTPVLDVIINTLERELFEELGVSIAVDREKKPFVVYSTTEIKSKKHLAIGWHICIEEDTKFRLDPYELTQKKGKSKSGSFIPIRDITGPDMNLEPWSKAMLLEFFSDQLTDEQKAILRGDTFEQLVMTN